MTTPSGTSSDSSLGDLGREAARVGEELGGLLERLADQVGGHGRRRVAERDDQRERLALVELLAGGGPGVEHRARRGAVLRLSAISTSNPSSSAAAVAAAWVWPLRSGISWLGVLSSV